MPAERNSSKVALLRHELELRIACYEEMVIKALGVEGFELFTYIAENTDDKSIDELLSPDHINFKEDIKTGRTPTNLFRAVFSLCRAKGKFTIGDYTQVVDYLSQTDRYLGSMSAFLTIDNEASEIGRARAQKKHAKNQAIVQKVIELLSRTPKDGGLKPEGGWGIECKTASALTVAIQEFIKTHNETNPDNKYDLFSDNVKSLITRWLKKLDSEPRKVYLEHASEKAKSTIKARESRTSLKASASRTHSDQ